MAGVLVSIASYTEEIVETNDLFLILVLTRGASKRGLVPTSKRRSASYRGRYVRV